MLTRRMNRLTRLWVMALLLLTPLILAPASPVHAQTALSATPTTVFVTDAQTPGTTTLKWSSGTAESVQVYVKVGNGQFVPTNLSGPSGTGKYDKLKLGQTYEFRLYTVSGQPFPASPTVKVTVVEVERGADPGCLRECIRGVNIKEGGTLADVHIETTVPVGVSIQATDDPPNANGSCASSGWVSFVWKPQPSKTFDGRLTDLEPNTTYCLKVIAMDGAGNEDITYRTFKTHNRYVTVVFQKLKIISAGDDEDDGEWTFSFGAAGTKVGQFGQLSFMNGVTVDLAQLVKSYKGKNNGKSIDIYVAATEDDTGPFGGVFPATGPEYANVEKQVFVGGPGTHPTYNDGETFMVNFDWMSAPLGSSSDIKFSVQGMYLVEYYP